MGNTLNFLYGQSNTDHTVVEKYIPFSLAASELQLILCHQLNSRNSILFLLVTIYYISQWAEIKNNNSVLPGCLVYVNILCTPDSNQNM